MQLTFALFADAANLSQEGKLNILGVFDAVQVAAMPTVHPRASLVLRLKGGSRDAGKHTLTLAWVNPDGMELWRTTGEVELLAPPEGAPELDLPVIAAVDLPIDRPGPYLMRIALDDQPTAAVPLQVHAPWTFTPNGGLVS
jgi:hypothetical protein